MGCQESGNKENEAVAERYALSIDRIRQMEKEETVPEPYREYFRRTSGFIGLIEQVRCQMADGRWHRQDLEQLKAWNRRLYHDILT